MIALVPRISTLAFGGILTDCSAKTSSEPDENKNISARIAATRTLVGTLHIEQSPLFHFRFYDPANANAFAPK
jgi:hypothetical protein